MKRTLPRVLRDWLKDCEMDPSGMSDAELLMEAEWCLECLGNGDEVFRAEQYHPNSVAALRRFARLLRA